MFYKEENHNGESIRRIAELDIWKDLDLILVIETCLNILKTKRLIRELYYVARAKREKTI